MQRKLRKKFINILAFFKIKSKICNNVTKTLSISPTIRRALSAFILVLFAFSITPKIFLHALVTHHKDNHTGTIDAKPRITRSGYNCDCENLVAESTFEYTNAVPEFITPVLFVTHQYIITPFFHSQDSYVAGLRGPPMV